MARVRMLKGRQKEFLNDIKDTSHLGWEELGQLCGVCDRTIRDWRREKYQMNYEALQKLHEVSGIPIPEDIKILPEYWSIPKAASAGGKTTARLYGGPGTPEGRRKGGLNSYKKFLSDPSFAEQRKLQLRKKIQYPEKSALLAEFIGILLGDGGIRNGWQISISFNAKADRAYSLYIQHLVEKLFGISVRLLVRREYGCADIIASSTNLVEFLRKQGIKQGNKVVNQVDVPQWIWDKKEYQLACLRGLMDTDGGLYYHSYKANGKMYKYIKICFTNYSAPLLNSVVEMLRNFGFAPKIHKNGKRVYLYKLKEVQRYLKEIGTRNPRYYERYLDYIISC